MTDGPLSQILILTRTNITIGSGNNGILKFLLNDNGTEYTVSDLMNSSVTNVVIPSTFNGKPVTAIGDEALGWNSNLTNVTIPNSIKSIGRYALYTCQNLISVTIPNSVITIGQYAFSHCQNLTSITIGNSVTSIGYEAFYACNFSSITIPNSVMSIGGSAFSACHNLISVTFQGNINANNFGGYYYDEYDDYYGDYFYSPFDGDLREKYLAGGIGTYNRYDNWGYYGYTWYKEGTDPFGAIQLNPNNIDYGNITSSGDVVIYSINVTYGTTYHLWWIDDDTNWGYADVGVGGYYSNGDNFFYTDTGDYYYGSANHYSFTTNSSGIVYIAVFSWNMDTGNFAIAYNTTGVNPFM
jgi:hypothetical protein